jgi:hypothetical protein
VVPGVYKSTIDTTGFVGSVYDNRYDERKPPPPPNVTVHMSYVAVGKAKTK